MASQQSQSLYPQVEQSHPDLNTAFLAASSSLYPTVDPDELAENLFPEAKEDEDAAPPPPATEETLVAVPGAQLHLVDPARSVDLGAGTLSVVRLLQGGHSVAVLARLAPPRHQRRGLLRLFSRSGDGADLQAEPVVQWPLTRDVAAVKLDPAHYFFSLFVPHSDHDEADKEEDEDAALSYGLTVSGKGRERDEMLAQLDRVLEEYTTFSVKQVGEKSSEAAMMDTRAAVADITPEEAAGEEKSAAFWTTVADITPEEAAGEEKSAAFWTTVAPNVDDYSSSVARLVARGVGPDGPGHHLVRGRHGGGPAAWGGRGQEDRRAKRHARAAQSQHSQEDEEVIKISN
jgi:spartin